MRSKWQQFLFIGLILSLVSSAIGCGESYTQKDLEGKYECKSSAIMGHKWGH